MSQSFNLERVTFYQDRNASFSDFEDIIISSRQQGLTIEVKPSAFEFQVGANEVMILKKI